MIELTRLNGIRFSVNCDLIKYVEAAPDTTLTLVTGEKLLVVESRAAVAELIVEARVLVLRKTWPAAATAFRATVGCIAAEMENKDSVSASPDR